ncbi:MAG TPA: hypothetical protein VHE80_05500 [Acidimicrobiales bacterium]|nr:hypothetical protein [Acidimicrobiales bacterium]
MIRIVDLAATSDILEDLVFDSCEIVGPAVLVARGSQFRGCVLDARESLWELEPGRSYIGAIGVRNCLFQNSRFRRVGIGGDSEFVRAFLNDVSRERGSDAADGNTDQR